MGRPLSPSLVACGTQESLVRRLVRATEHFWVAPDLALPAVKGRAWHAFAAHDLPDVVERFAVERDDLPTPHPRATPIPPPHRRRSGRRLVRHRGPAGA